MPATVITVDAVLFDMDGTLVDSTPGVIAAWEKFAESYPGLDVTTILSTSHGVRTVENLRKHCGVQDEAELEKEAARFERAILDSSKNGHKGVNLLPGVRPIMDELLPGKNYPNPRWAICTSATHGYASAALEIADIPVPDAFVAAEDVKQGKPKPDPYLLGAEKCRVNPVNCLVVEDAPAGVRSGQAAGCRTLALLTSHSRAQMEACSPDFLVNDLASISMKLVPNGVEVTMNID